MSQERFWNWMDDDSTFRMNMRDLVIIPYGLYAGFNKGAATTGLVLTLEHTTDNKRKVGAGLVETPPLGIWKTKQGVVVVEDESISLQVTAGHPTAPRIDLVVGEHEYVEAQGGAFATYKIINGVAASSPVAPPLNEPNKQVILGFVSVPAGATAMSQITFTKAAKPNFLSDDTVMHTDREQESTALKIFNTQRGVFVSSNVTAGGVIDTSIKSNFYSLIIPASGIKYFKITNFSHKLVGRGGIVWFYTSRALELQNFDNATHKIVSTAATQFVEANSVFGLMDVSVASDSFSTYVVVKGDEAIKNNAVTRFNGLLYSQKSTATFAANNIALNNALGNFLMLNTAANSDVRTIDSLVKRSLNPNEVAADEAGAVIYVYTTNSLFLRHGVAGAVGSKSMILPNGENLTVEAGSILHFIEDNVSWRLLTIYSDKYSVVTLAKPRKLTTLEDVSAPENAPAGSVLIANGTGMWVSTMLKSYIEGLNLKMNKTVELGSTIYNNINNMPLVLNGTNRMLNITADIGNSIISALSSVPPNTVVHTLPSTFQIGTEITFASTTANVISFMNGAYTSGAVNMVAGALQLVRFGITGGAGSLFRAQGGQTIKFIRMPDYWAVFESNVQADASQTDQNDPSYIRNLGNAFGSQIKTSASNQKIQLLREDGTLISEDLLFKSLKFEYGTAVMLNRVSAYNNVSIAPSMPFNWNANYCNIYPPTGFTTYDLKGFMASLSHYVFDGTVNSDDEVYCKYKVEHNIFPSGRIRVIANSTENRMSAYINFLAIWQKN